MEKRQCGQPSNFSLACENIQNPLTPKQYHKGDKTQTARKLCLPRSSCPKPQGAGPKMLKSPQQELLEFYSLASGLNESVESQGITLVLKILSRRAYHPHPGPSHLSVRTPPTRLTSSLPAKDGFLCTVACCVTGCQPSKP